MQKNQLCAFGKNVKHRLIDLDKTNGWLIDEIKRRSDGYMDTSFMAKLMSGKVTSKPKENLINQILQEEEERQRCNQNN